MAAASYSESSSEEENLEKFSEIVESAELDLQVATYTNDTHNNTNFKHATSNPAQKQSLRRWREEQEIFESVNNSITPDVRKHMAKKLTKYLDSCITWRKDSSSSTQVKNASNVCEGSSKGVYLFLGSKERLDNEDEKCLQPSKKRVESFSTSSNSSDENEKGRLLEAAVSGYSILRNGISSGEVQSDALGLKCFLEGNVNHRTKKKKKRKKKKKERDKE